MVVLKIFLRLLCIILFIVTIPLLGFQALYLLVMWCIKGGYISQDPLPFIVVDAFDKWLIKHDIDLSRNS